MSINGFQKHGLEHTSASQINMWEECPAAWVAKYLYNKKFKFGVAPQIGILTEKAVERVLTKQCDFAAAVADARKEFGKMNALNTNEKDLKRIDDIELMAELALSELSEYGEPVFDDGDQHKVELLCKGEGWEVPVIGFTDFVYPDHGLVVDLKTTLRIPSNMSSAHKRQAAIYKKAFGNYAMKFLYVSPKKALWHEIDGEDEAEHLNQIKEILSRQEMLLRTFSAEEMRAVAPLSLGSFYWNGDEEIRKELYGV